VPILLKHSVLGIDATCACAEPMCYYLAICVAVAD
jgi:hypothetical protein